MSLPNAQRGLLETVLRSDYIHHLPPLLLPKNVQEDEAKNFSRALAAFALSALCDVAAKEAAEAVVDDYDDFGLDAIYYHAPSETLSRGVCIQSKSFSLIQSASSLSFWSARQ